jgi:lipopolysaccharide export system permease protein
VTGITRYILRQLVFGTIVVAGALACIVWLTQSLRFLQYVVNKGLAVGAWLRLTLYLMPEFLVVVIPPALFFVALFIYNRLSIDRELVVAQAAGISRFALSRPALLAAAIAALVCYALTLVIIPNSTRAFRELQFSIRNDASQVLLREGTFNQIAPGLTVYVRGRGGAGELIGIMVHDVRKPDAAMTLLAERGMLAGGAAGPHVLLLNGSRQQLDRTGRELSVLYFDSYTVDFGTAGGENTDRTADYRERSLIELFTLRTEDGFTAREVGRMRAEGHQRLVAPLTCFSFVLAALCFLLTGAFDKRGQVLRVCGAVAVLVGLEAAYLAAGDFVGRNPDSAALLYLVGLLPTAVGLYIIAWPVSFPPAGRRREPIAATPT